MEPKPMLGLPAPIRLWPSTPAESQLAVLRHLPTSITVGIHRPLSGTVLSGTITNASGTTYNVTEATVPTVSYVAVSRGGNSANLSKVYAITTTTTTYTYSPTAPTSDLIPSWCTASGNSITCANLYSGTAIVSAAANGATPINTYITTIPAPSQVTYCDPGTDFDGPKNCPLMTPVMVLGRS
jgi:hypothetical protein